MSILNRPKTPCEGLCSHNVGDDICRGCCRTVDEVRDWPAMTQEQRKAKAAELKVRRAIRAGAFGSGWVAGRKAAFEEITAWTAATTGSTPGA